MIPDYQTLIRPVLEIAALGETKMSDIVKTLGVKFSLTQDEMNELLPSKRAKRFTNRVHWARFYLKDAGLVASKKRGFISATETGTTYLKTAPERISARDLRENFQIESLQKQSGSVSEVVISETDEINQKTPDERMQEAYNEIATALASDLLEKLRNSDPTFFESVIVELLVKMGYGAGSDSGSVIGGSGDDGVDGVINQDLLGVDQVYIQAKRYKVENKIGAGPIRDFYGALGLKDVSKGIFVTTSSFTANAKETAEKLGARIVLIDGFRLAHLMIRHKVGVKVVDLFEVSTLEDGYFD